MRRLAVMLAAFAAFAALATLPGCQNACQDLGDRICSCSGGGLSTDTCKQQIKNLLNDVGPTSKDRGFCSQKLDTCSVPEALVSSPVQSSDATFCEWVATACGKAACGLSNDVCPPAAPPTFSVDSGTYASAQAVALSDTTVGAQIFYTTDGSVPRTSSTLYTAPIAVASTTTIRAVATAAGTMPSAAASATYIIAP